MPSVHLRLERHRLSPDQTAAFMDQRQVERMKGTFREAIVKRYHYDSYD